MEKILLGDAAAAYLRELEENEWKNTNPEIKGGAFASETATNDKGEPIYIAFDCANDDTTTVEDFDNAVEAIKYASGIVALTRNGTLI